MWNRVTSFWAKPFDFCHVIFLLDQSLFLPSFWKNREATYSFPHPMGGGGALLARIFTNVIFVFWCKFLSCLVCVPSFKSLNSSSLSRSMMVVISLPPPHQQLQPQNMLVGTGFIELTEPSETLKYKSFFKHCILQTILDVFVLFTSVWYKIFCFKKWTVFYVSLIWFGLAFDVPLLKVYINLYKLYLRLVTVFWPMKICTQIWNN